MDLKRDVDLAVAAAIKDLEARAKKVFPARGHRLAASELDAAFARRA